MFKIVVISAVSAKLGKMFVNEQHDGSKQNKTEFLNNWKPWGVIPHRSFRFWFHDTALTFDQSDSRLNLALVVEI